MSSSERTARLPCAICGQSLAEEPERGCVAMTCDTETLIVEKLIVCCRTPCLARHAADDASILCDEDLASYLGEQGAAARARVMGTFGWTESAAREYLAFARAARAVGEAEGGSPAARLAS